jgi:hypothetical protein
MPGPATYCEAPADKKKTDGCPKGYDTPETISWIKLFNEYGRQRGWW